MSLGLGSQTASRLPFCFPNRPGLHGPPRSPSWHVVPSISLQCLLIRLSAIVFTRGKTRRWKPFRIQVRPYKECRRGNTLHHISSRSRSRRDLISIKRELTGNQNMPIQNATEPSLPKTGESQPPGHREHLGSGRCLPRPRRCRGAHRLARLSEQAKDRGEYRQPGRCSAGRPVPVQVVPAEQKADAHLSHRPRHRHTL